MNDIPWQVVATLVSIVSVFGVVLIFAMRTLLKQMTDNFELQFAAIKKSLDVNNIEQRKLERDFLEFKAAMPDKYMRRNDWIRFSSIIDAKQDTLGERMINMNSLIQQLSGQVQQGFANND